MYTTGDIRETKDVGGGSSNTYILTGLNNGATYKVSIYAIGQDFPSETVAITVALGEPHVVNVDKI